MDFFTEILIILTIICSILQYYTRTVKNEINKIENLSRFQNKYLIGLYKLLSFFIFSNFIYYKNNKKFTC